jgi:hypothetical protein
MAIATRIPRFDAENAAEAAVCSDHFSASASPN